MRIFLTTDLVGGVWSYTATLARHLAGRGHECAVAIVGEPDDEVLSALPPSVSVFARDLRLEWEPGGVADVPRAARWLAEEANGWDADVVHLGQMSSAIGSFEAPVLVVAHGDVLSWYQEVRAQEAPPDWAPYARVVEAGLRSADCVVTATEYQATRLRRHFGRAVDRIVPHGVDVPAGLPPAGQKPPRTRILTVGRAWDEAKGIELLDRALQSLGPAAPPVDLVGAVCHSERHARRLNHLTVHGPLDPAALPDLYRETRLYVSPALYEPFGLGPAEAAAHGCALLLSGIGSFRELWQDSAMFFRSGDAEDLAERLAAVLADEESCETMGRRAAHRARTRFSAGRMAATYEALYEDLVPQKGGARRVPGSTSLELAGP